jgi:hypothetical protein
MTDRARAIAEFLAGTDWRDAAQHPLQQDASNRRYIRLTGTGPGRAILMDAPASAGEDIRPFVDITERLHAAGLSAPEIYAKDSKAGLLLLEDLGDDLYADTLAAQPELEPTLYAAAVDVLIALYHATPAPGLAPYDAATMGPLAGLASVWYAPDAAREAAVSKTVTTLARQILPPRVGMIQRDYHAQNLLWLPARMGHARVGLLDYQDAMLGPLAYDLVSLTLDARRDVGAGVHTTMIARFADGTGQSVVDVTRHAAICGAQRNLRILGVFARLWLRDGKAHYLPLLPRVWQHLHTCLAHPDLAPLAAICADLPAPTPAYLAEIKARQ